MSKLLLLIGLLFSAHISAHEMEDPRITVVLREPGHANVTLYIDFIDQMHQQLAAQEPLPHFILRNANRSLAELDKDIQRCGWQLVAAMRFTLGNQALETARWQLPSARQIQEILQHHAMQNTIEPNKPLHPVTLELHGEISSRDRLADFSLYLAPPLQHTMVVWYSPRQAWSSPKQPKIRLNFPELRS